MHQHPTPQATTWLIDRLGDLADVLSTAPQVHRPGRLMPTALGLVLTYDPHNRSVRIKIDLDADRWD